MAEFDVLSERVFYGAQDGTQFRMNGSDTGRASMELLPLRGRLDVQNARTRWTERRALVVELSDGTEWGRGECAPLPGYSRETLDECEEALRAGGALPPAAEFAVYAARLELSGQVAPTQGAPMRLASLDGSAAAAQKRKIGRDLHAELEAARSVQGPIRFDANQSLGDEAARVLAELAAFDTEFVEEPVPFEELASLWPSPVPIALDESLQGADSEARLELALEKGWAQVLVLKPMALGPALAARLAEIARRRSVPRIVSHLFGGPLAYAASAHFAFAHGSAHPQGLGRHPGLDAFEGWSTELGREGMIRPWRGKRWPIHGPGPARRIE